MTVRERPQRSQPAVGGGGHHYGESTACRVPLVARSWAKAADLSGGCIHRYLLRRGVTSRASATALYQPAPPVPSSNQGEKRRPSRKEEKREGSRRRREPRERCPHRDLPRLISRTAGAGLLKGILGSAHFSRDPPRVAKHAMSTNPREHLTVCLSPHKGGPKRRTQKEDPKRGPKRRTQR